MTLDQLRSALDPDEPVHLDPQRVGPSTRILIRAVATGNDVLLAAKAVLFAAHLEGADGRRIIIEASRSANPLVREAAAHALRVRGDIPAMIKRALLHDDDRAVRARAIDALRSAADRAKPGQSRSLPARIRAAWRRRRPRA